MMSVGHVLDHVPDHVSDHVLDHVSDHMIIGLVATALHKSYFYKNNTFLSWQKGYFFQFLNLLYGHDLSLA